MEVGASACVMCTVGRCSADLGDPGPIVGVLTEGFRDLRPPFQNAEEEECRRGKQKKKAEEEESRRRKKKEEEELGPGGPSTASTLRFAAVIRH
jgi:hypothetical protein